MVKRLLALVGVLLFAGAVVSAFLRWDPSSPIPAVDPGASAAATSGGDTLPACAMQPYGVRVGSASGEMTSPVPSDIEMSEGEDAALYVTASTRKGDEECAGYFSARANDIRINPEGAWPYASDEKPTMNVFLLTPARTGKHLLYAESSDSYWMYSVKVTTWTGLMPATAQALAGLGTIFGPMLTIPWWLERRQARKEESDGVADAQG